MSEKDSGKLPIRISILSLLVAFLTCLWTINHDSNELTIIQRPYLYVVSYNYQGPKGQWDLPSKVSIISGNNPSVLESFVMCIHDETGKLFDEISSDGNMVIFTINGIESARMSTKLARYIRSNELKVGDSLYEADLPHKINGFTRYITMNYKSFNNDVIYTYESKEEFQEIGWNVVNINTYSNSD